VANNIAVKLIKSRFGRKPKLTATLKGLGLKRINQVVVLEDTPSIRGMINKVFFMVQVQPEL